MNYWSRYVTRVAVRRVVAILVLSVLAYAGIGRAQARTVAEAYALCLDSQTTFRPEKILVAACHISAGSPSASGTWRYQYKLWEGAAVSGFTFSWDAPCPMGTEWDDGAKVCHNRDACLDKSAAKRGSIAATAQKGCIDGCAYGPPPGQGPTTLSFNGSAFVSMVKGWVPTGGACNPDDLDPKEDQQCKQLGAGQTACVKPDGETCYSAAGGAGSQFCWKPGETGEKTDGDNLQKTNAGDQPIPPTNMQLPSGDSLVDAGTPPVTTTINNNGKTTTTTTNNYNTEHGTNAGDGPGQAEPGDGSGKGDGGDGEGDGKGTATGGDCSGGWVCAGDPIACAQLREANQSRCALEKGPGEGEGAGAEEGMGDGIGSLFGGGDGGPGRNILDVLGGSITQSRGCPPNPTVSMGNWGTIELPLDKICPHLQLMGTLMLGFAYLFAVKIMME